jgi:hypothetical protein
LIATGKEKAEVVRDVITGAREPERLPALFIHPVAGTLTWLLDKASSLLPAGVVKSGLRFSMAAPLESDDEVMPIPGPGPIRA